MVSLQWCFIIDTHTYILSRVHTYTHLPTGFTVFCFYPLRAKNSTEMLSRAKSGWHIADVNIIGFERQMGFAMHTW